MHRFHTSLNREKINENSEEGYKIQLTRCLFFKNTDVKTEREEKIDSLYHSTKETQRQTLDKAVLKGFLAKRRLALCFQGKREL